ncbi:MAG: hypothetical protein F9K40_10255 [Kofleriaceae bacterium]|nr:MAG: hypothetical protein F9K40_10255 [Kofleriaceae bacterium]
MRDDWSTPTDEFDFARRFSEPATPPLPEQLAANDDNDPMLGVTSGELRIVDAFFHELALEAAEDASPPTAAEQLAIDDLRERFERLQRMTPEEEEAERQRLLAIDRRLGMR